MQLAIKAISVFHIVHSETQMFLIIIIVSWILLILMNFSAKTHIYFLGYPASLL